MTDARRGIRVLARVATREHWRGVLALAGLLDVHQGDLVAESDVVRAARSLLVRSPSGAYARGVLMYAVAVGSGDVLAQLLDDVERWHDQDQDAAALFLGRGRQLVGVEIDDGGFVEL